MFLIVDICFDKQLNVSNCTYLLVYDKWGNELVVITLFIWDMLL